MSGISTTGALVSASDTNTYTVQLRAGEVYDFYLQGDSTGPAGYVHDPQLTLDGPGAHLTGYHTSGTDADIKFRATADGDYTLTVGQGAQATGAGQYNLVVTDTTFDTDAPEHTGVFVVGTTQALAIGDSRLCAIDHAGDTDDVAVFLNAGTTYTFDARGASSGGGSLADPRLWLLDSAGHSLAFNDDALFAAGHDSQITYTPLFSGTYYLKAGASGPGVGSYTLEAHAPIADAVPGDASTKFDVPLSGSVTGTIAGAGDHDFYALQYDGATSYDFHISPAAGVDVVVNTWEMVAGNLVHLQTYNAGGAGQGESFTLGGGSSAPLYVDVSAASGTGSYVLSASPGLGTTPPYPVNTLFADQHALDNEIILGGDQTNWLVGGGGNDVLRGGGDQDSLDGGSGADTMIGGGGHDAYHVDNIGDVVIESLGGGSGIVYSDVSYTLPANVEYLWLNDGALNGVGNDLDNQLIGNAAGNLLVGGLGDDRLFGEGGADTMVGGEGNDLYFVDSPGSVVTELANQGLDYVDSSVSFTLGANIEYLELEGTAAINGTGNALDNGIGGNDGANHLDGGAGNDTLDGGAGNDTMTGGTGNDVFTVDSSGDVVIEQANGGIDAVDSSASWTVAANVEMLTLTGSANINGTGNAQDNTIYGNNGANILNGAAGADTLIGGSGDDTFVGGVGKDLMTGGGGLDHFNFSSLSDSGTTFAARDVINTFAHGDKVDVSAIDANANAAGNQAFTFVDNFSHVAGQLEWTQTAPTGYLVQGDTNGDGAADFSVQLYAAPGFGTIHNWDFIL